MADAISIQELIDARTDAKTLEEAVNGDAVTTVLSRLGETYPTLSNALNQIDGKIEQADLLMTTALNQIDSKLDSADAQVKQGITSLFENGGLPATPFATKALMTASALVDGKYAMVTDDTVNNGLYVKTAGAWVKSDYNSLTNAKTYVDGKINPITPLYNPINNVEGKFVHISVGDIKSYKDYFLNVFPVVAGEQYAVYTPATHNDFTIATRETNSAANGSTQGTVTLIETSEPNVRTFIAPPLAKFAFANVKIGTKFDFRESFRVNRGGAIVEHSEIYTIDGAEIIDKVARQRLSTIENSGVSVVDDDARLRIGVLEDAVNTGFSVLKDKSWLVIGDSITQKNFRATLNYHDYVDTDVGGMTKIIKGYSGHGFVTKVNLPDELTTVNPDYITIALGTNDSTGGLPLGDFLSTDTGTLSGCINTFITKLLNKYPLSKIAFFTPLPRANNYGSNATKNSMGYALIDVVMLIKKYADHYSLPCLDLYHASNLHPWIPAANEHFFSVDSVPLGDGLHPNDAGQRVMADKIRPFLESL